MDTREKANSHITDVFDKFNVKYVEEKLDFGDYSCYYSREDGTTIDMRDVVSIERKSGLNELTQNFTSGRKRFEREFQRHKGKMVLAIEDTNYNDMVMGRYRSNMSPKSLLASIHSWSARYSVPFIFIDKHQMAVFIYLTLKYTVREYEKELRESG